MHTRTRSWKFAHWFIAVLGALCATGLCADLLGGRLDPSASSFAGGRLVGQCFWVVVGIYAAYELLRARRGEPLTVPDSRPYVAALPPQQPYALAPQPSPAPPHAYVVAPPLASTPPPHAYVAPANALATPPQPYVAPPQPYAAPPEPRAAPPQDGSAVPARPQSVAPPTRRP